MKKLIILSIVFAFSSFLQAQEYKHSLSGIDWVKIESRAVIKIKTHSSNELLIETKEKYKTPERAKGLKLVGENGTDNTDVGFYVITEGNNLIVRNLKKGHSHHGDAILYLPANQNISVTSTGTSSADIFISGFKGEIEAESELNGDITINDISGPVTANALNGDIEISFSKVNQTSPITIYATNGAVDVKLPSSTPAELSIGTINGEIYTNFDLNSPKKGGLKPFSTQKIKQSINGGGVPLNLKTTNGNIYLRKQ